MRRLVLCLCVLVVVLGASRAALAGGPLFVVVPASAQDESVARAVAVALSQAHARLVLASRARRSTSAELARANAMLAGASDPFPVEDRISKLAQAVSSEQAQIAGLQTTIRRLKVALQPVRLPVGFSAQPAASIGEYAVQVAERYLGVRYLWGGAAPSTGFDCSGFVKYVYAKLGVDLPHYAASQYADTPHVSLSQIEPGDLVFFEPHADGPGHVGMYVGDGAFIEAPHTGDVVKLSNLADEAKAIGLVGVTRPTA